MVLPESPPPGIEAPAVSPSAYTHYLQAQQSELDGDFSAAADQLRLAIAFDPTSARLHFELAMMLFYSDSPKAALRELKQAQRFAPGWAQPYFWLGEVAFYQNLLNEADQLYRIALKLDPNYEAALKRLAEVIYIRDGALAMAAFLEVVSREKPDIPYVWATLAKLYRLNQEYGKSETCLVRLLELQPSNSLAIEQLAGWYNNTRRYDQAIALFENLRAILPPNPALALQLGIFQLRAGNVDKAAELFTEARSFDPMDLEMALAVGFAYLDADHYAEAASEFKKIVKDFNDESGYYLLGYALMVKGDCRKALKYFSEVDNPAGRFFINAQIDKANCLWKSGQVAKAQAKLDAVVKQMPDQPETYRMAAHFFRQTGALPQAIDILNKGLARLPDNIDLLYLKAILLDKMARNEEALAAILHLLAIDPHHADALNFAGYTFAEKGIRLEEAERMIRQALRIKPDEGYIIDSLGWLNYRKGDMAQAVKWLQLASVIEPQEAEILLHLAMALRDHGGMENELLDTLKRAAGLAVIDAAVASHFEKEFPDKWPQMRDEQKGKPAK